ncbi:hypothetical protein ACE6H2_009329 [Prunus campanulata]
MASWPSLSNPSNQKRSTGSQFKFLVAPIYAYVLPRSKTQLYGYRLFTYVLVGAFALGFYLVYPFSMVLCC